MPHPLAVTVIAELLGVPTVDRERLRTLVDKLLAILDGVHPRSAAGRKIEQAAAELLAYLHEHCADRQAHPEVT